MGIIDGKQKIGKVCHGRKRSFLRRMSAPLHLKAPTERCLISSIISLRPESPPWNLCRCPILLGAGIGATMGCYLLHLIAVTVGQTISRHLSMLRMRVG